MDIDERSGNLDPHKLATFLNACRIDAGTGRAISRRSGRTITGIVPVHLYGQMADMDGILVLAKRFNLKVVEDACQAHGATYFSRQANCWKPAGSMGDAAAFSFYPSKNLGACGEAGAVTTNNETIAAKVRMLRDHGQSQKYIHDIEGYNGRLDAIQAGILGVKLRYLPVWTEQRRARARRYGQLLQAIPEILCPKNSRMARLCTIFMSCVCRTGTSCSAISPRPALALGCIIPRHCTCKRHTHG